MPSRWWAGLGVQGDAHAGKTLRHRSRVARDPGQANLRQVHLLHAELFDELMAHDFAVWPSDLGENITTSGIDLLALPTSTRLHIGAAAVVEKTLLVHGARSVMRVANPAKWIVTQCHWHVI